MEFFRPEYRSGLPFPSPGDLPNPGIEPRSPSLQADSLSAEPQGKPKNTGVGSQPIPSPGDLPDPGIEPVSPALQADSSPTYSKLKPKKKKKRSRRRMQLFWPREFHGLYSQWGHKDLDTI